MCMILFNVFILIFIIINGNIFNRTVTYVFTSTHVQLKPRAASELEANARIEDMFENVISPLLNTRQADLIQCGRYQYPVSMRLRSSRAVAALLASIMIFFSGKNVASQREYMQQIVDFPCCLPLTQMTLLLLTRKRRNSFQMSQSFMMCSPLSRLITLQYFSAKYTMSRLHRAISRARLSNSSSEIFSTSPGFFIVANCCSSFIVFLFTL